MRKITDKTIIIDKLEAAKKIAEADISFHKATISLVEMLKKGVENGFIEVLPFIWATISQI